LRLISKKTMQFWPLVGAVFLLDRATKQLAEESLMPPGIPHSVVGDLLRFTLGYNPGGALGIETGPVGLNVLIVFSIFLILGLTAYYFTLPPGASLHAVALGLIVGGALGNLLDRLSTKPGVVDFIDVGIGAVGFWTFNVADAAISVGALLLAWRFWREPEPAKASSP